jgi:hypothetical protein
MPTVVQFRRGTTAQNNNFTGANGEISVDTTDLTLRVHNGSTVGGNPLATQTYVNNAIGALSANSISSGTSSVSIIASNGNIRANIAGTTVQTISTGLVAITGDLSVSGNATLSGNILGDRIQNGTTTIDIQTPSGNANISVAGTSNVAVFSTTGLTLGTGSLTAGSIVNANANGVGNIGSSTNAFNTVFAKATSAQYADLAEMYVSDQDYLPGTVVEFGGTQEITITTRSHSTAVAGIVSTNPSYLMNSAQAGDYVLPVALTGRVPCQVQGPVRKGDVLVSSATPGVAQRIGANWQPGCVLGKAMEEIDSSTIETIEVAVGRL